MLVTEPIETTSALDEPAAPPVDKPSARARTSNRGVYVGAVASVLGALVIATFVLQLWRADLSEPFVYQHDYTYFTDVAQTINDTGWYEHQPRLGAPFEQNMGDYPVAAENFQMLVGFKALSFVTDSGATIADLWVILSFPLVALSAFLVLHRLRISQLLAVSLALLYSFLPYHLSHVQQGHMQLVGYYVVPVAVLMLLVHLGEQPFFADVVTAPRGMRLRTALGRRNLLALGASVFIATGGLYYTVFFVLLLLGGTALNVFSDRVVARIHGALVLCLGVGATLALISIPNILYVRSHGQNPWGVGRAILDSEVFGLKLSYLLLPTQGHRIAGLAAIPERLVDPLLPSEGGQALGLIGAIAFVGLLVHLARRALGQRPAEQRPYGIVAVLTLLATLIGTAAGFSLIFAATISSNIRAWSRIGVVIAFLCFVAVGWVVQDGIPQLARRVNLTTRGLALLVPLALLGVGLLDQTNKSDVPEYTAIDRAWKSDAAFVGAIEQRLPTGAMVYQLPFIFFAGSPTRADLQGYDLMKGFSHSKDLRWSYGGLQGREADWQYGASHLAPDDLVALLAGAGFDGLTIDRAGYDDHAADLERALTAFIGGPDLVSPDKRLSFFDLSKAQASVHRDATTGWFENASGRPVPAATADVPDARIALGPVGDTDTADLSSGAPTRLDVYGLTNRTVSVEVVATVDVEGVVPADLAFNIGGQTVPITRDGQEVRIPFSAPMGKTTIGVALVGPAAMGTARAQLHIVRVDVDA